MFSFLPMRQPTQTRVSQVTSEAATYATAKPIARASTSSSVSRLKIEKVVKPPQNPRSRSGARQG
jgi:hypothetical protein